jgi:hypothetical protein
LQGAFFGFTEGLAWPIPFHLISQQFDTFQDFRLFLGAFSQNAFRDHK